ncbi:MAG: glycosyltransferase family 4 protein [Euryarchaeota archaeon]|nr:glycosyltransferase family 4 protein [Euryarchaeota archaeon]
MRVSQACFRFGAPGGAEDHVLQISRELVRRGHEVVVHASDMFTETPWKRGDRPDSETIDGISVKRHKAYMRPVSDRWSMLVIPGMVSGLLEERCDLYHAHSHRYFQLEAAATAARARDRPLVITPHYHPAEEKETARTRLLLKLYDLYSAAAVYGPARRVLTVTELEKGYISHFAPAAKCRTVGNGIDPAEWEPGPSAEGFREHAGIEGRYILYSGRLASNKGLEHLFAAMPSIAGGFDGTLVVLGKDWGMKAALAEAARRGGFGERVRFIDFLPDRSLYRSALAGCELLVLPSQWEAFGIVLLEAAMCRRPVVAAAVGGVPEVVEHGRTGLLVPYGDPGAISRAVAELLQDGSRMRRMGEEGRRLALERHTWPKVADRILEAYGEALR